VRELRKAGLSKRRRCAHSRGRAIGGEVFETT
jgi:hypothetical protein